MLEEDTAQSELTEYLAAIKNAEHDRHLVCRYGAVLKHMECFLCFRNSESENGIYVHIPTFLTLCKDHLNHVPPSNNLDYRPHLYLHLNSTRDYTASSNPSTQTTEVGDEDETSPKVEADGMPKKLGIGVVGGFEVESEKLYKTMMHIKLCLMKNSANVSEISLPDVPQFDDLLQGKKEGIDIYAAILQSCRCGGLDLSPIFVQIISSYLKQIAESVKFHSAVAWEEEQVEESKHSSDLYQICNPPKISRGAYQCAVCGAKDNLWMNLSDGYIGCGRLNFGIGGGCSGNREGAAVLHNQQHSNYHLAAKLGTITAQGDADVFSYSEDRIVKDQYLSRHLAHFGINVSLEEKTDKTLAEMQIEHNIKFSWSRITEKGENLMIQRGPGHLGLKNFGNTCYMNSALQLLLSVPQLVAKYSLPSNLKLILDIVISSKGVDHIADDLLLQFSKLLTAASSSTIQDERNRLENIYGDAKRKLKSENCIESGDTTEIESDYVAPDMFCRAAIAGHPEFSTLKQQDAEEFLRYFLHSLARCERPLLTIGARNHELGVNFSPTWRLFAAKFQTTLRCLQSNKVKYFYEENTTLSLILPPESTDNHSVVATGESDRKGQQNIQDGDTVNDRKRLRMESAVVEDDCNNRNGGDTAAPKEVDIRDVECPENSITNPISLKHLLDLWAADAVVEDFLSPVTGQRGKAHQRVRFITFPPYLFVQLKRFYTPDGSWCPQKIQSPIKVPDVLDVEHLRCPPKDPKDKEISSPRHSNQPQAADNSSRGFHYDESVILSVTTLGFSENAAKRGIQSCGNNCEAVVDWVVSHSQNIDIDLPLEQDTKTSEKDAVCGAVYDEGTVTTLASMGFTERQVKAALHATGGDANRAGDWLFSRIDDLDSAVKDIEASLTSTTAPSTNDEEGTSLGSNETEDGPGLYELVGFASHAGSNVNCGHYVAHVFKDSSKKWVLFNDCKVAESISPPKELGYLYLYKRIMT